VIDRDLTTWPPFRWALAALALSVMLALWAFVRAVRIEAVPESAAPAFSSAGELAAQGAAAPANLGAAVARDLFSPDRSAPAERYRVPGEEAPAQEVAPEEVKPIVLGTSVSGAGRSFATCRLAEGPPVIVRVGDKIGDYTVKTIERGRVVFTTANGKPLDVPALKPGS
jgi:hypothetical protein